MLSDALAKNDCKKIDAIELADLRKYISNLILTVGDNTTLPVESNLQMWGGTDILKFRAVMWSKRLEVLSYITSMVTAFEKQKREYFA